MIAGIVAVSKNGGIGLNNDLPWPRIPADMQWFRRITTNNIVVMGGNTWQSLPSKLPGRVNVTVGKRSWDGCDHSYLTLVDAITHLSSLYVGKDIFIIGGQQLYESSMDLVEKFFVTAIDQEFTCDKFFNLTKVKNEFKNSVVHTVSEKTDTTPGFCITEYTK